MPANSIKTAPHYYRYFYTIKSYSKLRVATFEHCAFEKLPWFFPWLFVRANKKHKEINNVVYK